MHFSLSSALALAVTIPFAIAQTSTSCNPLEKTCPKDLGLNAATFTSDFTKGKSAFASWSAADGTTMTFGDQGAEFTITESGQAPTVQTDFYFFFGRVDIRMSAAPGTGIVSSIVMESDDLDEIDIEFLGGNTAQMETNFFGKGNTTVYDRAIYYPVSQPQSTMHTYSIDWNSDRLQWIIDGKLVRTIPYSNSLTVGGINYPQTPMRLKLGNWCGGCKGEPNGTVAWAGGETTFDNAPYVMYVESVSIQNANPADSYEYTDNSGSWQSIKIIKNGSTSNPKGTASIVSSVTGTHTSAPTSMHQVGHITGTGAVKTASGNSTVHPGGLKTATSTLVVPGGPTGATATPSGSATATASVQNSAATLGALTSGSLLAIFFGFLML